MIGRGGTFNAAEAVSPGGMTPAEWNAVPGAIGGEAPASVFDWRKAIVGAGSGLAGAPQGAAPPFGPSMAPMSQTTAQPINFQIVNDFLASLLKQAGTGRKSGGK